MFFIQYCFNGSTQLYIANNSRSYDTDIIWYSTLEIVERLTTDLNSSSSITFDRTLSNMGLFWIGPTLRLKNPFESLEKVIMDSDSPYPITFDQTLWELVSHRKYPLFHRKYLIWSFENMTAGLYSPYSIIYIWTMSKLENTLK